MAAAEPPVTSRVGIRDASWIVAWDAVAGRHAYARDGDVVWEGDRLIHVGGRYDGHLDEVTDGRDGLVLPGLVNVHCHPSQSSLFRGLVEEFGNPRLFYSSRHRFRQAFVPDVAARQASAHFALAEMLAMGVTTIVDLSHAYDGWLDLLAASGLRCCAAPMFRSARWWTDTGKETRYEWADDLGAAAFAEARRVMDAAEAHPSRRLSAMVAPAQVDTCTEELLRASAELARATGRPLHVHAAQSYAEFANMTRRHDATPIAWLEAIGFLGPTTILGHAVFTDQHPWLLWPERADVARLARTGTTVAHCPTVFARDGTLMHDLGSYLRAGVRIAIGTDTHPHNVLEEIRWAEILARVAAGVRHRTDTAELFHAATVGGARALGRDDIGRLAVGAKADLVLCRLDHPQMRPVYDPLRSLIHAAADRAVADVWVDGTRRVRGGKVLTIDQHGAGDALQDAQERIAAQVPAHDPDGADLGTLMPRSLPELGAGAAE